MEEVKIQERVQEQKKWDNPSLGFDPSSLHHETQDEPKLSLSSFPKWIILILVLLFLIAIAFIWFIYFRKPNIKTSATPTPTPTTSSTTCATKPVCYSINVPSGCKIIQPQDPCKCPSAYICPTAE